MNPTRILHSIPAYGVGGIETFVKTAFQYADRDRFVFDFLVHTEVPGSDADDIHRWGGIIHRLKADPRRHPVSYLRELHDLFSAKPLQWPVFHAHTASYCALHGAFAAAARVPIRIAHAHASQVDGLLRKAGFRASLMLHHWVFNRRLACSRDAAEFFWGRSGGGRVQIFPNGIEIDRFAFSPQDRTSTRRKLGLGDGPVLGHSARFAVEKNHEFLIKIFGEVSRRNPEAVLMLIGDGPLLPAVSASVKERGLEERVLFLGYRTDVPQLLSACDAFVLPSLHESFGIAALEAQASGLPCLLSDVIPPMVHLSDKVGALSLSDPAEVWAEAILALASLPRSGCEQTDALSRFDIEKNAGRLGEYYSAALGAVYGEY